MSNFEDTIRGRFHEAVAEKEAILEKSRPLREAYDRKRAELNRLEETELRPLESAMKEAEVGLYELSNEIATMARALKGFTG